MNELITYPNGLRLVVNHVPTVRSVAIGFWVGAGSVCENPANNGISHFTEHVMFKGTNKFTAFDIANEFESLGALVNAFTGKEATCYYVKSVDEYAEKCFETLAHIFTHSSFDAKELDKERRVIIEEINMVEDSPEDICYDLLAKTLYNDAPLGQTILGPSGNVERFTRYDVISYMDERYNADNIVISVSGNIDADTANKYVEKYLLDDIRANKTDKKAVPEINVNSGILSRIKDFEQSNIGISYPSLKFMHPEIPVQNVFNIIFGGCMGSRLFQRIREQMGLAYSVYSSPLVYVNNGNFNIVLNITAANTEKVLKAVKNEINTVSVNGVTKEEFDKAKIQLKSALVFSEENIQNMMSSQGKMMLLGNELYNVDNRIREIDSVTISDVNRFARDIFSHDAVCAAYVGKETDADILKILKGE